MSPVDTAAPRTELGTTAWMSGGAIPWNILAGGEDPETNQKLQFPQSVLTYHAMRIDPQLQGLLTGTIWPITQLDFYINPNGAPDHIVKKIAADYGLPIGRPDPPQLGGRADQIPRRRYKRRFNFQDHLYHALLAVIYGFMFFEQVGEIDKRDMLWHLRKLAYRMPHSISEIKTEADGGLNYIKQMVYSAPEIKVDRLIAYPFQKEGANWQGRSLLRGCYGPWLLKDRVMRVGAMNIQRAGVGIPIGEAPPGATDPEIAALDRMCQNFKAGERAGGALPNGAKLRLVGVEGSQPNSVEFIKLCNEEMARSFLAMFMMLGQTETGSRSLGGTFLDFYLMAQKFIADWFCGIFNEHMIEDDVDWNWGEDVEFVPRLEYVDNRVNPVAPLADKVANGDVQVDPVVAAEITAAHQQAHNFTLGDSRPRRNVRAAGASPPQVPGRALRRQPYDHEIQAAVDWTALDSTYESSLALLVQEVRALQYYQVDELHDAIVEADGDLAVLAKLSATPQNRDLIADRLQQVAAIAAAQHVEEARLQGATVDPPNIEVIIPALLARAGAVDELLTQEISQSAAREAVRLTGGGLDAFEVADAVKLFLEGRSGAYARDLLGGSIQAGINEGRKEVMREAKPDRIYASALLDANTCSKCIAKDGTEYATMAEAVRDFPVGAYKDCEGRERDRCTLVAVYGESTPTLETPYGL
jgi:hypothetical protein